MRVIVGTRGSALARRQTAWVIARLQDAFPDLAVEEQVVRTRGDEVRDRPLHRVGGRGLFVRRIEEALAAGEIDLAVHSLKDLPTESVPGLVIGAVPAREDPRDALVSGGGSLLAELPPGAVVGTSSRRRAAQLLHRRPDVQVRDVRGNVDTRLRKMLQGDYHALIMAAAGLRRLGLEGAVTEYFPVQEMVPAAGQGALAVQVREADARLREMVACLENRAVRQATDAERAFLRAVGGGCALPVGAYATVQDETLTLRAMIGTVDGRVVLKGRWEGPAARPEALAQEAGLWLLNAFQEKTGRSFTGRTFEEGTP